MSVHIRLRKIGKNPKKRPYFRVTVFNRTRGRDSRFIEEIGFYDPTKNPPAVSINMGKFDEWVKKGALPSDTVRSLIKKIKTGG